jgi:hypothetical protein
VKHFLIESKLVSGVEKFDADCGAFFSVHSINSYYIAIMNYKVIIKKTTILFAALLLGGNFLQSCSDEEENTPSTNRCYIIQEVIDYGEETESITYEYNDNNNIIIASSVENTGTTSAISFEYDGNRIVTATEIQNNDIDDVILYEFKYSGNNSIPSRVDVKSGTEITGYYVIQSSGQNITEFEDHDLSTGDDIINSISTFSYNNSGNLTQCVFNELNTILDPTNGEVTNELEEFLKFDVSTYDNRKNPNNSNFVFFIMYQRRHNFRSQNVNYTYLVPLLVGNQNIVSGTISLDFGKDDLLPFPFVYSYEYNDKQYYTSSSLTIPGFTSEDMTLGDKTLIYNCK